MLVARRSLHCARTLTRHSLLPKPEYFCRASAASSRSRSFATTPARRNEIVANNGTAAAAVPKDPQQQVYSDPYANELPIEAYVRNVREVWGENLPEGLLSEEEYKIYERYYGPPVRTLTPEEVEEEYGIAEGEDGDVDGLATLQDANGGVEEVEEEVPEGFVRARSAEEAAMYARIGEDIQRSMSLAEEDGGRVLEGEHDAEAEVDEELLMRTHPLTELGRFGTFPTTTFTPVGITKPTAALLSGVSNKHLDDAIFRILGASLEKTPIRTEHSDKAYNSIPLNTSNAMSEMDANVHMATILPGYYAQSLSTLTELRRRLGRDWILGNEHSGEKGVKLVLDVGTGGAGVLAWRAMVEAERQLLADEASEIDEEIPTPTEQKAVVVMGSQPLRYRMAKLLENTTFIPRLPDMPEQTAEEQTAEEQTSAPAKPGFVDKQPRKLYDLIIATNTILPIYESHKRKSHVQRLWSLLNPNGGVLLLVEKGTPRGFEAIAGARKGLLKYNIATADSEFVPLKETEDVSSPRTRKETSSIVAPCTNHSECPLYVNGPAKSISRDFCSFSHRYQRPNYMQRVLGAKKRNHEDLIYSYVAVRRGIDVTRQESPPIEPKIEDFDTKVTPPVSPYSMAQLRAHAYTLPRAIFPPMKRTGHVVIDVCTPKGKIERWTVPRSYGKVAFRDARKSKWGDLWALGAKTKIARNIKLGEKQKKMKVVKEEKKEVEWKVKGKKKHWGKKEVEIKKERGKGLTLERASQRKKKDAGM
ncbi:37S ribosomal protein-like protein Rsm22 [Tricharina praecox]|uniref:37S ribosomal protein-like protein Rsm22 n=1 Tax=Tricharina praecox TaxID=43433 RepID=UPI0022200D96|nr:37S ribosomal protein-like protein Rsm22 [Tricharina praecox]KAI5844728.1 37S ribosomal protein-like protein Rsm22 [Tricharina praecox]